MRTLGLLMIALLLLAGAAQAQVAAPRLNPLAFASTQPFNPAVLPWSGASRIGGGLITNFEAEDIPVGGPSTVVAEGDGMVLQARGVGETFSAAAELLHVELDLDPVFFPPPALGTFEIDTQLIAIAFRFSDNFAVGIAQQSSEERDGGNATEEITTETLPMAGLTFLVGEGFYFGGSIGTETVEKEVAGVVDEGERQVTRGGVAYRMRNGDKGAHVEIYSEGNEVLEIRDAAGVLQVAVEEDVLGLTAEFVVANFLIAVEVVQTDRKEVDPTGVPAVRESESDDTNVSLGWAPEQGLAVVATAFETEEKDTLSGDVIKFSGLFVGAAWQF